jgi:uncharacterized protein (TIGR03118 family)
VKPFILVTDQGTIFTWGPDAQGDLPAQATLEVNNAARNAVYKGVAILNSSLTQPALAVTDFHGGFIDTFIPGFASVALPGSFTDPNLPLGFAPFGIQVIRRQVFVTYALQDAAKHDPVIGAGNGIVSIFDMDGNSSAICNWRRFECAVGHRSGQRKLRPIQQRHSDRKHW